MYLQNVFTNHIYIYKLDLALDNQQWLICHKTKVNEKISFYLQKPKQLGHVREA